MGPTYIGTPLACHQHDVLHGEQVACDIDHAMPLFKMI